MTGAERVWSIVVPVKPTAIGKSRLEVPGVDRRHLARAIALDTIAAAARARSVAEVVVVTDDPDVRAALAIADRRPDNAPVRAEADPGGGLNDALAAGLEAATGAARAVLLGDLPALRPTDLDDALRRAPRPAVVADADGTGTTLFARAEADLLRFGPGSYARHRAAGAAPLDLDPASTLRRDVDTAAQLAAARALGLGPHTAALLA